MGKVMRHTLGASLNIRHNLSSSKGPKPLQLKLLTTYIPKTSRSEERFSRNAETDIVCRLLLEKKKIELIKENQDHLNLHAFPTRRSSDLVVEMVIRRPI